MSDRTSRTDGTTAGANAPATPAHTVSAAPSAPGTEALRAALGTNGYRLLDRQRQDRGTALGQLADLLWNTAREADRLHGKLRRHAAHVRDRLDNTLNPRLYPAFAPATGLLHNAGHATDLHAARFGQQMNQLTLVLDSYQAALRRAVYVTGRS